jgi:hypothetical protein
MYATAAGRESFSYNYGQHSKSSGGFDANDPVLSAYQEAPSTSQDGIFGVSTGNPSGGVPRESGSSQSFTLNALGHWGYSETELADWATNGDDTDGVGWTIPSKFTALKIPYFVAYLDGGYASKSPKRFFRPRRNSAYSFTIDGVLSFTKLTGSSPWAGGSEQHAASFTYKGGIITDFYGNVNYNCSALEQNWCSLGSGYIMENLHGGGGPPGVQEFQIQFCASDEAGWASWDGTGARSGDICTSTSLIQSLFAIQVTNNSDGLYVAEALSAKIEMVECSLQYRTRLV